ncbi:glutathione S-transferase family protein [Neisseriaceae bacterium JH1-16]|nr:glutathione S-transferase family protein [Neisseriaceae bacterium JH1-16]
MFTLIIGNKNTSSWSLRPWLILAMLDEPFTEVMIRLGQPDSHDKILAVNPAGKVPLLIDHHLKVWDSLAICEYLNECFPGAQLWPEDPAERAHARSLAAEMHAGFAALRHELPMDVCGRYPREDSNLQVDREIARIIAIWEELRAQHVSDGPFLFGRFGIVDAMFAPVACRFVTYDIALPPASQAWLDHLLATPAMRRWITGAEAEVAELTH